MSDALYASRLPDLPNAGYATRAAKELSDAMMFLIRGLERDRLVLLQVVLDGQKLWRKRFIKAYRVIKADEQFADAVFGYLVLLAGPDPAAQKARLEMMQAQQDRTHWDRRLRTLIALAKDRKHLEQDILRESLRAKRTTFA